MKWYEKLLELYEDVIFPIAVMIAIILILAELVS